MLSIRFEEIADRRGGAAGATGTIDAEKGSGSDSGEEQQLELVLASYLEEEVAHSRSHPISLQCSIVN